ncbi:MAG: YvcK family protein [Bacilli bacterium]|nr:YvcK family protein [Bacilli bacterium]
MKKIVIFGGGTGLSCILSGLKLFPVDVTAIISVSDNGSSTGQLKKEFDIPAVGDVGKVLLSMANADNDFMDLLSYRFTRESFLENHPIKNILLTALIDIKGNITDATKYMCKLLDIRGTILPLTEEKVELVGEGIRGKEFLGEEEVSQNVKYIKKLKYDHSVSISKEIIDKILEADLILFSSGSLYTSILPHLIVPEIRDAIRKSEAPTMYISNLVSQPGETDGYSVSDHIKILNDYLDSRKVDIVLANNAEIDKEIVDKYSLLEHKTLIEIDREEIKKLEARLIEDKIFAVDNGMIRHNALKTAYLIFSYLMESE